MQKLLRGIVAIPGLMFGASGLLWIVDPQTAAANLGVTLPEGIARSTIVGDLGAFFLFLSAMILMGAVTSQARWMFASAALLATAAGMRVLAWGLHDAAFAAQFIAVEVIVAALLAFAGTRIGQGAAPQAADRS